MKRKEESEKKQICKRAEMTVAPHIFSTQKWKTKSMKAKMHFHKSKLKTDRNRGKDVDGIFRSLYIMSKDAYG